MNIIFNNLSLYGNFIIVNFAIYVIVYWSSSLICYLFDKISVTNKYIKSYKIQQDKHIDYDKYHSTIKNVLKCQLFSFILLIFYIQMLGYIDYDTTWYIPRFVDFFTQIIKSVTLFDFMFYINACNLKPNNTYVYFFTKMTYNGTHYIYV